MPQFVLSAMLNSRNPIYCVVGEFILVELCKDI